MVTLRLKFTFPVYPLRATALARTIFFDLIRCFGTSRPAALRISPQACITPFHDSGISAEGEFSDWNLGKTEFASIEALH